MQKIVEYSGMNNRLSPATVELLIRARSRGKSLRQLGQMFNKSHESIRQLLAKYNPPQVTLLPEERIAANLGYPSRWLARLRKEGIINPIRPGRFWLYSEEQVRQIPPLIAETRKCEQCGKPCPPGSHKICGECSQYKRKHPYLFLSPEQKASQRERCRVWRRANPERLKEIRSSAYT